MTQQWTLSFVQTPAPQLVTSGRIDASNLDEIQAGGVTTVVNLCPPAELDWDEQGQVEARGLDYINIPVAGAADLNPDNARRLRRAVDAADGTVLVHCQSSNRVGALFAVDAWLGGAGLDDALAVGRAHGMTKLEEALRQLLPTIPRQG